LDVLADKTEVLDFDDVDARTPRLAAAMKAHVPSDVRRSVAAGSPGYVGDARDVLFQLVDRNAIVDAVVEWVRSSTLACYHGTRLTDTEVVSVQTCGLIPLAAQARQRRLIRALSPHPNWNAVVGRLDDTIRHMGRAKRQVAERIRFTSRCRVQALLTGSITTSLMARNSIST
jgi:hypothetical protein